MFDPAFVNFFRQAGFQHVDTYFDLLGVQSVLPFVACIKASAALISPIDILTRLEGKLAKFRL